MFYFATQRASTDEYTNKCVWAIDANGKVVWTYDTGSDARCAIYYDGYVYIGGSRTSNADSGGNLRNLWKVNAETGAYVTSLDCGGTVSRVVVDEFGVVWAYRDDDWGIVGPDLISFTSVVTSVYSGFVRDGDGNIYVSDAWFKSGNDYFWVQKYTSDGSTKLWQIEQYAWSNWLHRDFIIDPTDGKLVGVIPYEGYAVKYSVDGSDDYLGSPNGWNVGLTGSVGNIYNTVLLYNSDTGRFIVGDRGGIDEINSSGTVVHSYDMSSDSREELRGGEVVGTQVFLLTHLGSNGAVYQVKDGSYFCVVGGSNLPNVATTNIRRGSVKNDAELELEVDQKLDDHTKGAAAISVSSTSWKVQPITPTKHFSLSNLRVRCSRRYTTATPVCTIQQLEYTGDYEERAGYSAADDNAFDVYDSRSLLQTFSAPENLDVNRVKVKLWRDPSATGTLRVSLNSSPTVEYGGVDVDISSLSTDADGAWLTIDLDTPITVSSGTEYLKISTTGVGSSGLLKWYSQSGDPYADGIAYYYTTSLNSWYGGDYDFLFEVYTEGRYLPDGVDLGSASWQIKNLGPDSEYYWLNLWFDDPVLLTKDVPYGLIFKSASTDVDLRTDSGGTSTIPESSDGGSTWTTNTYDFVYELWGKESYTPPVVTGHSGDLSVIEGSQASLFVIASGNPSPTYQWYKDGVAISGATSSTYTFYPSLADAGTYQVKVSNLAGDDWSGGMEVTVISNPYRYNPFELQEDLGRE